MVSEDIKESIDSDNLGESRESGDSGHTAESGDSRDSNMIKPVFKKKTFC